MEGAARVRDVRRRTGERPEHGGLIGTLVSLLKEIFGLLFGDRHPGADRAPKVSDGPLRRVGDAVTDRPNAHGVAVRFERAPFESLDDGFAFFGEHGATLFSERRAPKYKTRRFTQLTKAARFAFTKSGLPRGTAVPTPKAVRTAAPKAAHSEAR
jgi:hypothetical protein